MKTIHIPRTNSIAVNAMYTLIGLINIALPQAICQDLNLNTFRPEFSIYTPAVQNITDFMYSLLLHFLRQESTSYWLAGYLLSISLNSVTVTTLQEHLNYGLIGGSIGP